jgi:adenylate cyclase
VLVEALEVAHKDGERYSEAELYRLKGQLLLNDERMANGKETRPKLNDELKTSSIHRSAFIVHSSEEAEACFLKAIEIARQQQAKSLELRAVMSLSRLWQQQGRKTEARPMLAEIYGWFTEGFETKDLREAKALLEELA